MTHDRANPSGEITLLTILSSVSGGREDGGALGGERRNGPESDLEITDAAWDEARREQASRVYVSFITSRSLQAIAELFSLDDNRRTTGIPTSYIHDWIERQFCEAQGGRSLAGQSLGLLELRRPLE